MTYHIQYSLFESDITDYEDMNKIVKSFEPYANLWQTAKVRLQSHLSLLSPYIPYKPLVTRSGSSCLING